MQESDLLPPNNAIQMPSISSSDYGYGLDQTSFSSLISQEYPALKDTVYLDHAASPPTPPSAVQSFANALSNTLYANPHSHSPSSSSTALEIDRIRGRVLQVLFGVKTPQDRKWDVIFTAGATAALKLVGEAFPWNGISTRYRYLKESHTSLVGIRGCALAKGASVEPIDLRDIELGSGDETIETLWGYPAQCNVTGSRLGLGLARELKRRSNAAVLVDAAGYLSTSVLDLDSIPYEEAPDFVACSFYKIYGQPTGLGALIVKRTSAHLLSSPGHAYFGGGTIDAISVSSPFWSHPRSTANSLSARYEHGTLPFLSIIALDHAMNTHYRLYGSHSNISKHAAFVAGFARDQLSALCHASGQPLVRLHHSFHIPLGSSVLGLTPEDPGPVIGLTLFEPHGSLTGHNHVEHLTTIAGIQLRTGGMCNTGVLARVSGLDDEELKELYEGGRVCGDHEEFGGKGGRKPLGVVRISFGASSTVDDVLAFVNVLRRFFLISNEALSISRSTTSLCPSSSQPVVYLQSLTRYPIKSCAGESILASKLTATGLSYDREFMLVNPATGYMMSQKQFPRMALVRPIIDEEQGVMRVRAEGMRELIVSLEVSGGKGDGDEMDVKVCGDVVRSHQPSLGAAEWFSTFLGIPCQLHRFAPAVSSSSPSNTALSRHTHFNNTTPSPMLLANESPFVLISQSSVDAVNSWIALDNEDKDDSESAPIHPSCFRANFTISLLPPFSSRASAASSGTLSSTSNALVPFQEDTFDFIRIGTQTFQVLARCRRCLMICVNQKTGERMKEPFCSLARHRRNGVRRIEFGVHLVWREGLGDVEVGGGARVEVGDRVVWSERT